jgi:hypothetical protein
VRYMWAVALLWKTKANLFNNGMHNFGIQHPGICLIIIAIMLMLSAWIDYGVGLKPIAYVNWFLGGVLGVIAISCLTGGYLSFLGIFRWPIAAIFFVSGMYSLWRFRPKNHNPP